MAGVKRRSGGARVGAGRKRRDPKGQWLTGSKKVGPRLVQRPEPASTTVRRPAGMASEDAAVWEELAPFALANGTLTPAMQLSFAWLCQVVVLERKLARSPLGAAGPDHRGMMQRKENLLARFRLIADGKPVAVPETQADEWTEFDGPTLVKGA